MATETVADVGDVLDVGVLVVVRQNDGVALPAKGVDFVEDVEDGLDMVGLRDARGLTSTAALVQRKTVVTWFESYSGLPLAGQLHTLAGVVGRHHEVTIYVQFTRFTRHPVRGSIGDPSGAVSLAVSMMLCRPVLGRECRFRGRYVTSDRLPTRPMPSGSPSPPAVAEAPQEPAKTRKKRNGMRCTRRR